MSHELSPLACVFVDSITEAAGLLRTTSFAAVIFDLTYHPCHPDCLLTLLRLHPRCLSIVFATEVTLLRRHQAFSMDADDFLPRKDDLSELKLSLISRLRKQRSAESLPCILRFGAVVFDVYNRKLTDEAGTQTLKLSDSEGRILHELIRHHQRFVTRETFFSALGISLDGAKKRPIDQHVSNLRKKLKSFDIEIVSKKSQGYMICGK